MDITPDSLATLRRPRLLVSAARFGLARYDRETVLKRIFGDVVPMAGEDCMACLLHHERQIDIARRNAAGGYSIAEHVDVLSAIMAEGRLIASSRIAVESGGGSAPIPFPRRAAALR